MAVICVLLGVWTLLLATPLLAGAVGDGPALLGTYAGAAAVLLATRPPGAAPIAARPAVLIAAWTAGCVSYPGWIALTRVVGGILALPPPRAGLGAAPGFAAWLAILLLAPLFEELLYRERVLDAVSARLGAPAGLLASSALFALPHAEPWHVTATFLVGLGLGVARCVGAPLGGCVAFHAGLNAAAWSAVAMAPDPGGP